METVQEEKIRALAEPLWQSASAPYEMAMDFWLMAEQMVREMLDATARLQKATREVPSMPDWYRWPPEAMPVQQVRALAETMWQAAGRQYGAAQDFWLAAERHVVALMRATAAGSGSAPLARYAAELAALPPDAYMERVRVAAYYVWETTGCRYEQSLDCWLRAEQEFLRVLLASDAATAAAPAAAQPTAAAAPATTTEAPGAI